MNKEKPEEMAEMVQSIIIGSVLPVRIGDKVYWISDDRVRERLGGRRFEIETYEVMAIRLELTEKEISVYVSDGDAFNLYGGEYAIPTIDEAIKKRSKLQRGQK